MDVVIIYIKKRKQKTIDFLGFKINFGLLDLNRWKYIVHIYIDDHMYTMLLLGTSTMVISSIFPLYLFYVIKQLYVVYLKIKSLRSLNRNIFSSTQFSFFFFND